MADPVTLVEERQAQHDLGLLALRVYRGARAEADSWREAFWATVALLIAMVSKQEPPE